MIEDVPPRDVWEILMSNPDAYLCDVRTTAEWHFVGIPDLSQTGKKAILIEWQLYPSMHPNDKFIEQLSRSGVSHDHRLYFICRAGARSMAAALVAKAAGFKHVFNVKDGFEGPHDQRARRGHVAGWKHDGLPWSQP